MPSLHGVVEVGTWGLLQLLDCERPKHCDSAELAAAGEHDVLAATVGLPRVRTEVDQEVLRRVHGGALDRKVGEAAA